MLLVGYRKVSLWQKSGGAIAPSAPPAPRCLQPKATQFMGRFEPFPPNAVRTVTCPMILFLASLKNSKSSRSSLFIYSSMVYSSSKHTFASQHTMNDSTTTTTTTLYKYQNNVSLAAQAVHTTFLQSLNYNDVSVITNRQ